MTNQRSEMGINYANNHLAMGQMTRILLKSTSPGARGVTAVSPDFEEAPVEHRSGRAARPSTGLISPSLRPALPTFQFLLQLSSPSLSDRDMPAHF